MAEVVFIPNLLIGVEWEHSPEALALIASLGEATASRAQALAPVRTGALRASIASHAEGITTTAKAAITAEVPYAAFVEFGTSDTPAQPYLRPALDSAVKG